MQKIDDDTIKRLKSQHKQQLYVITDRDGDEYVCRCPTSAEVERQFQNAENGMSKFEAMLGVVKTCIVWPDAETFSRMLEEFPMLSVTLDAKIGEIAKLDQKARVKKL